MDPATGQEEKNWCSGDVVLETNAGCIMNRLVVQGGVEGTRWRERSPMRWTDQIKAAIGGPLHEYTRLSVSRDKWQKFVRRIICP